MMLLYGLDIGNLEPGSGDASPAGPRAARWYPTALDTREGEAPGATSVTWTEGSARLDAVGHLAVEVRRRPGFSVLVTAPAPVSETELIHPVMTFAGAVIASWTERIALHAASVVIAGSAWLLAAPPGGGKSTAAASLRARGHAVLADDLSVLDGRTVLAGPRSADLRMDGNGRPEPGTPDGERTPRGRWRVPLGEAPAEAPLGGVIMLEWGTAVDVHRLRPAERIAALAVHDALGRAGEQPGALLDLVDVPTYVVRQSRDWARHDAAMSLVEDLARGSLRP